MSYCVIKGKMCEWTTADGYCSVTACKDYDRVIPSNGMIYVPFSKLKKYMADDKGKENEWHPYNPKKSENFEIIIKGEENGSK